MSKNIVFYNDFHFGDLHYVRGFIKDMYEQLKDRHPNFYYYVNNDKIEIYKDLPFLVNIPSKNRNIQSKTHEDDENIYVNTWIGHDYMRYVKDGCSLYNYYFMFSDIYKYFGIELKNIEHYIPKVYYENLNKTYLKNIDTFIEENKDKKLVLICNGNVLSRQSQNFDFNPILTHLSSKYKNCLFIYTANLIVPRESNLIITNSIIKKEGVDLNEISYLSLKCDIIIGRESGPFCYTRVKENYLNDKKTYICFCNNKNEGLWHKSDYAKQIWSKNYVLGDIINVIEKEISLL